MSDKEHDHGIPGPPPTPAFFDPTEALRKAKRPVFGRPGPDDAREVERIAADKGADSAAEDKEDKTRQ